MKGHACSWQDMRKIQKILTTKNRLEGELTYLKRCVVRSAISNWNRTIAVMNAVPNVHLNEHVQPTHAQIIGQRLPQSSWSRWIRRCEHKKLTTAQLREAIQKDKRARRAKNIPDIILPDTLDIRPGDFRVEGAQIADASASLIFTDPPYDKDSKQLYEDLAKFGARVLKPGGSLLAYVGHHALPDVLPLMAPHLRYWWLLAVRHQGSSARLHGYGVFVQWKPIVWFVNQTRELSRDGQRQTYVADLVDSQPGDKKSHRWAQGITEAQYYIEYLTNPGDLVIDPMCGSGTTLLAALQLGRRSIGFDLDSDTVKLTRHRLHASLAAATST